jgi:O-antigen/teichoic acid export membrane protein
MKTTTHATGRQIATGAAWMMGFKLLDKSVGLISTLVLARVLTPTDFGLVAMAMAVVALLELMGAFGFESALIQRQNTDRSHYDTAWTFNVMFGVAISIMLLVMAMPAADFYREPRLALMLPALAVGALIGGFENIGTVAFRKELDFRKEFKFLLAKRLAAFTVTITLALTFQSFWALIAGTVTGKLMAVFISYRLHPYRPRLTLAARDDLLHFSKWIFISNLIQFLHSRSTDFILGRTVGSHGLGVYNIASEIAAMPSTELIAPLNRAVYPAYARLAGARDQLWERFLEVFGIICLLAFPVAVGLYCLSDLVVSLLLGAQWQEAVPIMQIAGLSGLLVALQSNMYLVILAMGQPKANTLLSGGLLLVSLPAVILASLQYGVLGAAYAHLAAALLGLAGIVIVFSRVTGLPKRHLFAVVWRPLLASGAMALVLRAATALLAAQWPAAQPIVQLVALLPVGAISYLVAILVFWVLARRPHSAEQMLMNVVRGKILAIYRARLNPP